MLRTRDFADEIVVAVDAGSTDATEEIARRYGDLVYLVDLGGATIELVTDWLLHQATGDWILSLDDDQFVSLGYSAQCEQMMADRRFTHYYLPQRWVVRSSDDHLSWIRQFPWYPDYQLRMMRNLGGTFGKGIGLHDQYWAMGEGAKLDPDGDVQIYHMDTLWRSREEREDKVRRYRRLTGSALCEEYYLHEDYGPTLEFAPVPAGELDPRSPSEAHVVMRDGIDLPREVTPLADLEAHAATLDRDRSIWAADYLEHSVPAPLLTNRGYIARVTVRNASSAYWPNFGTVTGRVVLCYRWLHETRGVVVSVGDRTLLPAALAPGDTVSLLAGMWTPAEPGRYLLQWDMLCEGVAWFSDRGVTPATQEVEVHDHSPRPRSPHFAEPTHATASGQPIASDTTRPEGRLIPIPPVRVLDTRVGAGLPGAIKGPVFADSVITLTMTGHGGIPQRAIGISGVLSALEGTYNGYLTAFPTDGTRGEAFVSVYFNDRGDPSASQTTSALGAGEHAGKLSIHPSANYPGTVEVVLDITAYLI